MDIYKLLDVFWQVYSRINPEQRTHLYDKVSVCVPDESQLEKDIFLGRYAKASASNKTVLLFLWFPAGALIAEQTRIQQLYQKTTLAKECC
jgi:hypothetical protein